MMKFHTALVCAGVASVVVVTPGHAAFTITQQAAAAPTYSIALNFDEPATPTGLVPSNYWSSSHGITIIDGVNGPNTIINDVSGTYPWINSGNANVGNFGVNMTFDSPIASMSFQAWDPSGPPSFFGNGLTIILMDINENVLDFQQFTGAWGGIGDTWIDITTSGGDSFEKVIAFNNSFDPLTIVDNLSWTKAPVPAPGAFALLGAAGMIIRRRRRA